MRINLPEQIDRGQWLERMGVRGEADARLTEQMEMAERKLFEAAAPQGIYRVTELESDASAGLKTAVIDLPGSAIKKHLAECNSMTVMAVTLGAGIDRLIRTSQIKDMAEAVILDSGASILAEQCADILEGIIRTQMGGFATGRYSPGYGDFPIEIQGQLIKAVDGPKTIGLTTNESYILIPRKSITAIIGMADHPVTGYLATCDECLLKESCRLRASGTPCFK